ncbi:hypothetical protein [Tolypothrix sp. VBCCA 56010]|uniref:hypothetical protein n=1 Tax=Tolypothrix sp. VBCCA 56010 TaxID=3137731 RepID=UPI003D7D9699
MSEKNPPDPKPLSEEEIRELTDSAQKDPIDLRESAKSSQEKTAPRFSRWREVGLIAGRFAGRLVRNEAVAVTTGPAAPVVGAGVGLYDTYRFGEDLYDFYKKEKALAKTAEHTTGKAVFHKVEEQAAEQAALSKSKYFVHADRLEPLKNDLSLSVSIVLGNPNKEIYHPTLAARISKAGDSVENYQKEVKLVTQAIEKSANLPKNYLSGTAGEGYQFALSSAHKELGKDYLNRVSHPDRILRFEKTTAEWLYKNGHEVSEVNAAIKQNSPYITGLKEVQQEQYLKTISERIVQKEPSLENAHKTLVDLRLSNKISSGERLTPKELEVTRHKAQLASEMHMREVYNASMDKLEKYRANPNLKLTTKEEYQVELGRRLEGTPSSKFDFKQQDKEITTWLILARHKPEEIINTLNEASFVKSQNHGQQVVNEVMDEMKKNPIFSEVTTELKQNMDKGLIPRDETRLDKLGYEFRQSTSERLNHIKNPNDQPEP